MRWRASSRALAIERGRNNVGPVSRYALDALIGLGIEPVGAQRLPQACTVDDLAGADMIIALKEAEHRPLLAHRFAGWDAQVTYWQVHDVDVSAPTTALPEIARHVDTLIATLRGSPSF